MSASFKKILVIFPVVVLGFLYLYDHTILYKRVSGKRILFLMLTLTLLYGWIFLEVMKRKQRDFWQIGVQASFYVYIFMVLTLTGYFILFREISAHDWWEKMMIRIERKDHVNFELFKIFRIYEMSNTQIVGNFLMLLPLGIYLPLLYKRTSHFLLVFLLGLLVSALIEFLQLITSYRSADVDDVLLNTMGACAGYIIYAMIGFFLKKGPAAQADSAPLAT
jgi:glycopeptide antibiotics resistance protein